MTISVCPGGIARRRDRTAQRSSQGSTTAASAAPSRGAQPLTARTTCHTEGPSKTTPHRLLPFSLFPLSLSFLRLPDSTRPGRHAPRTTGPSPPGPDRSTGRPQSRPRSAIEAPGSPPRRCDRAPARRSAPAPTSGLRSPPGHRSRAPPPPTGGCAPGSPPRRCAAARA